MEISPPPITKVASTPSVGVISLSGEAFVQSPIDPNSADPASSRNLGGNKQAIFSEHPVSGRPLVHVPPKASQTGNIRAIRKNDREASESFLSVSLSSSSLSQVSLPNLLIWLI
ncbi:unnamed protein product [Protopolystoma xenopodis]|uniref:Uncharacterized protein n=1 Tax=Protopolystoma xenopodis TaxID=117903 RepID=A0A448WS74_9PLAT|nr:unnamed protein product [Protopolystoma xenopodis]